MNERPILLKPVGPASLADEADFCLGNIRVRPPLREVEVDGVRESLEPRVMQVLVALVRANGAVLSRDELIRQCWGGRIVGEDAINRCVSKVRQIAELGGGKAFEIETIPRVGYRLIRKLPMQSIPATPSPVHFGGSAAPEAAVVERSAAPVRRFRFALAAAAAMVFFVVVAAAVLLIPKPVQQWAVVESHQPFISTSDIERFPSFSPDGTMIAYSRGTNAHRRQIFLQLRRGGDPLQLTHDALDDFSPAFSPDGTSVAYVMAQEKRPCRIMLAQVPSGPSREIGHCRSMEKSSLGWDHSGRALFYSDRFNPKEFMHIVRYDIDTGGLTVVTTSGAGGSAADFQPSVSPDGKTLLYFRYLRGNDRLQLILRGLPVGPERILVDDDADKYAAWSNDSSTLFVTRNMGSDSSLWAYPASGGTPWRITSNARLMEFLSSGPNGLLAVELANKVVQLSVASASVYEPSRPLDTNGFAGCSFDYAPDGTVALITKKGEAPIIAVGAPGHVKEILRLKQRVPCGIRWSPDGTRLAFGTGDSNSMISVITRDGMPVAQVPYPTQAFGYFEWTQDGKGLLQARFDMHGSRVWRVDLVAPYKAVPILPYGWNWVHMRNGMIFGMKDGSPGIWRIDGSPRRLTDLPSPERAWTWALAGDRIVYPDFSKPDRTLIMAQPASGGPPTIMGYAEGLDSMSLLAVDPASGQVTYNRVVRNDPDIGWLRLVKR